MFDDNANDRPQRTNKDVIHGPQNEEQVKIRIHGRTGDSTKECEHTNNCAYPGIQKEVVTLNNMTSEKLAQSI